MLTTEAIEQRDALRNVLSHVGLRGSSAGGFLAQVKKRGDHDGIKLFDEMAEFARAHYPELLAGRTGESGGKGDYEQALFDRLRQGFSEPPSRHAPEVMELASEMMGPDPFDTDDDKTASEVIGKAVKMDPNDPFSEMVPFSAKLSPDLR